MTVKDSNSYDDREESSENVSEVNEFEAEDSQNFEYFTKALSKTNQTFSGWGKKFGSALNVSLEQLQTSPAYKKSTGFLEDVSKDTLEFLRTSGKFTTDFATKIPSLVQQSEAQRKIGKKKAYFQKLEKKYGKPAELLTFLGQLDPSGLLMWVNAHRDVKDFFVRGGIQSPEQIRDVSSAWAHLSLGQKKKLEAVIPFIVGSLEGLPWEVRDRANRRVFLLMVRVYLSEDDPHILDTDQYGSYQDLYDQSYYVQDVAPDSVLLGVDFYIKDCLRTVQKVLREDPGARLLIWDLEKKSRVRSAIVVGDVDIDDTKTTLSARSKLVGNSTAQDDSVYNVTTILEGMGTGPHKAYGAMHYAHNVYTMQKNITEYYSTQDIPQGSRADPAGSQHAVLVYFDSDQPGFPPSDWSVFGNAVASKIGKVVDSIQAGIYESVVHSGKVDSENEYFGPCLKQNIVAHSYGSLIAYSALKLPDLDRQNDEHKKLESYNISDGETSSYASHTSYAQDTAEDKKSSGEKYFDYFGFKPLDSLVFLGSSGLHPSARTTDVYVISGKEGPEVYATEAKSDNAAWIGRAAWSLNPVNPTSEKFGAFVFTSNAVDERVHPFQEYNLKSVAGHNVGTAALDQRAHSMLEKGPDEFAQWILRDGYMSDATSSLFNIGLVTTGHGEDIITEGFEENFNHGDDG